MRGRVSPRCAGCFLGLLFLVSACSHLPTMKLLDPVRDRLLMDACESPYVKTPHRFVHAIEAHLPGGGSATLIGVTMVEPAGRILHGVLMTLEGLVLFEGREEDGALHVFRAVPPFDRETFVREMMSDMRLLFLPPRYPSVEAGVPRDGGARCRRRGDGEIVDLLIRADGTWRMETSRPPFTRLREVSAAGVAGGFPQEITLKRYQDGRYTLRMKLISAEQYDSGTKETDAATP